MDKSILNRITALENRKSKDLIIYAITTDGELTEGRVKDIITEEGELKEGFSGIGCLDVGLVKRGNNLQDLDRILKYQKLCAEKDCIYNNS